MEAVEEPPVSKSTTDDINILEITDTPEMVSLETNCTKANGINESVTTEQKSDDAANKPDDSGVLLQNVKDCVVQVDGADIDTSQDASLVPNSQKLMTELGIVDVSTIPIPGDVNSESSAVSEEVIEECQTVYDEDIPIEETTVEVSSTVVSGNMVTTTEKFIFETKVVIESCSDDANICKTEDTNTENNILIENSELSEALLSSNMNENIENNNCPVRQEVFNKEELLDILQGNDTEKNKEQQQISPVKVSVKKSLETQLALNQLSRLKQARKKPRGRGSKNNKNAEKITKKKKEIVDNNESSKESIISVLVKDWEDDEATVESKTNSQSDTISSITSDQVIPSQENITEISEEVVGDKETTIEENKTVKVDDESQCQRRQGRVIKKKVIFDPDNPDTFTKSKTSKDSGIKEHTQLKKNKSDQSKAVGQLTPKQKSLTNKMQWKKPTPKQNRQNRRLTEVDKLLMDEGAVNMIYQLTPEAPKGKKNMRTKAEFIKKIQSSTPNNTNKFRERKKDCPKYEEGDAKKIIIGRHRASLSSVKSPSVCEDFETHSADDSIIYRRHSSSSYSSTCMSPRRLSDVEQGTEQSANVTKQASDDRVQINEKEDVNDTSEDVFMSDASLQNTSNKEIINKNDCLSIKEKLNSKLSLVLNKRKGDTPKTDKLPKQKKMVKLDEKEDLNLKSDEMSSSKFLSINFDQSLALIHIRKTGCYTIEMLKELEQALLYVDSKKDVSTTLLTSECGTLCSNLELRPLLDNNMEKRTNYAYELAEALRSLVCTLWLHTKILVVGVWGSCSGVALAVLASSDVAAASETSTFELGPTPVPGLAALTARHHSLPRNTVCELVVMGRALSATEALASGLVTRTLWPVALSRQLRDLATSIAAQPAQTLLLRKQVMNLSKSGDVESTFMSSLEAERDLLAEYWTSLEGQDLIRASLNSA